MKSTRYAFFVFLAVTTPALAQNDFSQFRNLEFFGGFSHGTFTVNDYHKDFDGFAVSAATDWADHFGYEFEYARQYGSDQVVPVLPFPPPGSSQPPRYIFPSIKESQLLFGLRNPAHWKGLRVFGHTLMGASKTPNHTKFTLCLGGGMDLPLSEHFSLRVLQVDYIPQGQRQDYQPSAWGNNIRFQTGIVYTIGPH
ncbi:MAG: porin family protein [Acidobacteriia bacterium]|nr:porin family protein [Terriglobia bacterium]